MSRSAAAGVIALLITIAPLGGREPVNDEVNARIRKEGREHSQILRTMHYLTDVYGPRSAIAIAAAVYHLAMRDEMLPRFSKEEMPAPAGRR